MSILALYQTKEGREQLAELLTLGAQQHSQGLADHFLEKDIWVVEILRLLFAEKLIGNVSVAFKGGTALSKGWNAIHRFSEDIDLSIHWADLPDDRFNGDEASEWARTTANKTQNKKFRDAQTKRLIQFSQTLVDKLNHRFAAYQIEGLTAELNDDSHGEKIHIQFPRVTAGSNQYQLDYILLEFGARNRGRPTVFKSIKTYLADVPELQTLELPVSHVDAFSPDYILWEKLTALHQFSTQLKEPKYNRLARHWYDVDSLLGSSSFNNSILAYQAAFDVVDMKKNRWAEKGVDYTKVLQGDLVLLPNKERLALLAKDHQEAVDGGLFYTTPDRFSKITARLENYQSKINGIMPERQRFNENIRQLTSGAWMQCVIELNGNTLRSEFSLIKQPDKAEQSLWQKYVKSVVGF